MYKDKPWKVQHLKWNTAEVSALDGDMSLQRGFAITAGGWSTPANSVDRFRWLAQSWGWSWTPCMWSVRGGCCQNSSSSWPTLKVMFWWARGARGPEWLSAPRNATQGHSFPRQSSYTTPSPALWYTGPGNLLFHSCPYWDSDTRFLFLHICIDNLFSFHFPIVIVTFLS